MVAEVQRVEEVRRIHLPDVVKTLFVGESAPDDDTFFYFGNSNMTRYMQRAVEAAANRNFGMDFLAAFKGYGWYLDDLVITRAVNKMPSKAARKAECRNARTDLAERIAVYQPGAVVSLLRSIDDDVEIALCRSRVDVQFLIMSLPGMGHHGKFHSEMVSLFPSLPKLET